MSTKETLLAAFNNAKVEANALLEQIVITPAMNSRRNSTAQSLAETANTAYLRMNKMYTKIMDLQDTTISGDDLES